MKKTFYLFLILILVCGCQQKQEEKVKTPLTLEQIDLAEPLSRRNIVVTELEEDFGLNVADDGSYHIFTKTGQYEINAYVLGDQGYLYTKANDSEAWLKTTITDSEFIFDDSSGDQLLSFLKNIHNPEVISYEDGVTTVKAKMKNEDIVDDQDFTLYKYRMTGRDIDCEILIEYNMYTAPGIFFIGDIPEDFDYTIYSYDHEKQKIIGLQEKYDEDPSQFKYGTEFNLELISEQSSEEIAEYDVFLKYNDDGYVIESSYTDMFGTNDVIKMYPNVETIKVNIPEAVLEIEEDEFFNLVSIALLGNY